jgi:hypothetical protein
LRPPAPDERAAKNRQRLFFQQAFALRRLRLAYARDVFFFLGEGKLRA